MSGTPGPIFCHWWSNMGMLQKKKNLEAFAFTASRTCGQPLQNSSQRERSSDLNFTHRVIPSPKAWCIQRWCGCGQAHLRAIKQTTPNELLRHRHISLSLLKGWLMCVYNTSFIFCVKTKINLNFLLLYKSITFVINWKKLHHNFLILSTVALAFGVGIAVKNQILIQSINYWQLCDLVLKSLLFIQRQQIIWIIILKNIQGN